MLAIALMTCGCIKDDRSHCVAPTPPTRLMEMQFSQTINDVGRDMVDEISRVRIYVFNQQTGVLSAIIEAGVEDIAKRFVERRLPNGQYTMVAWAGSLNSADNGFRDAVAGPSVTNTDNYTSPVQVGTTTIDRFRMMLDYNNLPSGSQAQIAPRVLPLDNMFYSIARNVTVSNDRSQIVGFDFIRNFATFDVRVVGIKNLTDMPAATGMPLRIFVTARNAVYGYDNAIDRNTKNVLYEPGNQTFARDTMKVEIKTLRLDLKHVNDMPLVLHIQRPAISPATGWVEISNYPVNLTGLVMSIEENGTFPYRNQDLVDRKSAFEVETVIAPLETGLSVNISINGFRITQVVPIV